MSNHIERLIRREIFIPLVLEGRCGVQTNGDVITISMWVYGNKPSDFVKFLSGNRTAQKVGSADVKLGSVRFRDSQEFSLSDPELMLKVREWINQRY